MHLGRALPAPDLPGRATLARRSALAVALAAALSSPALLVRPAPASAWDAGAFDAASERQLVSLTNRSRELAGLPSLAVDRELAAIARWRSRDMVERAYFSHDIPGGGNVFDELSRRSYCFDLAGENIGWNTWSDDDATAGIHAMFLESPGHRRNVVGGAWDVVAVGAYKGVDGRKVWTVLFADACGEVGGHGPAPAAGPATTRADPSPAAAGPRPSSGVSAELRVSGVGGGAVDRPSGLLAAFERIGWLALELVGRMLAVGTAGAAAR